MRSNVVAVINFSKVVPTESSRFGSRKREQRDMMNKNYTDMCRFEDRRDADYQKVLGVFEDCLDAIERSKQQSETEEILQENRLKEERCQGWCGSLSRRLKYFAKRSPA